MKTTRKDIKDFNDVIQVIQKITNEHGFIIFYLDYSYTKRRLVVDKLG